MAYKGYGVARIDGKVVFIPYSVIGDEAWIETMEEKKDYSIGKLMKLIQPSPWRTDPLCPYFGLCGGCQWQHIDDSVHGELKREILKEVLKRLSGQKEIPSIAVSSSPEPYGYRVRVQLKVKEKAMGYYQERSHHIVDIEHCPISHPLVNQIIPLLRQDLSSLPRVKEIEINVSPEEGKGIFILHSLSPDQGLKIFLKGFLQSHPIFKGLVLMSKGRLTPLGDPHLNFTISLDQDGRRRMLRFRTSPESFFQVNLKQNEALIQTVLKFSDVKEGERVLDLYAGVGNLTLPLALASKEVLGIEENAAAVEDARLNAERNGINNCNFIHGRVEDVLNHFQWEKLHLVVLDPPRMGCKTVLDQIVRLKPEKIVYVSCDPTTLSRDLHLFSESGYSLQGLSLIDMFPQTYHMEVVGLLRLLC